jgi:hypothetical protein
MMTLQRVPPTILEVILGMVRVETRGQEVHHEVGCLKNRKRPIEDKTKVENLARCEMSLTCAGE